MTSGVLYGGDDIGALVFDVGNDSLRVGYAQDATPKAIIPAAVGSVEETASVPIAVKPAADVDETKTDVVHSSPKRKFYIDTNYLHCARQGMEVTSYMKDGMIEDWDLFEKVLDYTYAKCIQSDTALHPVLMSEPPWNERTKRERLVEVMFEKYNVPAFFLVKNAVLAAFANGRVTGIIVDSGATHTSAVPILDGFVLSKAVVKTPLGGDYITLQCRNYLQQEGDIIDTPQKYTIDGRDAAKENERVRRNRRKNLPEVTESWHDYITKRHIQDFQASVLQVHESPFDRKIISSMQAVPYEFPHGYHRTCGIERFLIPEAVFDPSVVPPQSPLHGNTLLGVGQVVTTSIGMCDMDVRPSLYGSVVVTGGNSFLKGFTERLNRDLSVRIPSSMRLKLISANSITERRFGAWIGGSILASIGTCQQFWISSQEYKEEGKAQVERKCP